MTKQTHNNKDMQDNNNKEMQKQPQRYHSKEAQTVNRDTKQEKCAKQPNIPQNHYDGTKNNPKEMQNGQRDTKQQRNARKPQRHLKPSQGDKS